MAKKFGDHLVGQKRLIFIRGALTNGAKVASERKKKLFFFKQLYLGN